jgi:hypothetical protein
MRTDMDFELISPSEFDDLPHDDEQCFVEFESICRRNMTRMINEDTNGNFDRAIQAQYMASVASVALECGLKHLYVDLPATSDDNFYEEFSKFSLAVQGEVARIRIRGRKSRNSVSVQLTDNTRTKIEHYIVRLRDIIDKSDLAAARKSAMHGKLNELTQELEKQRLNLGKTMAVLSVVLVTLAAATTIAAEGPSAVTHIMELIGADKESEDAAVSRLAPPPKALPAPPQKAPQKPSAIQPRRPALSQTAELDDDIPF